jgi:hypothetical protein
MCGRNGICVEEIGYVWKKCGTNTRFYIEKKAEAEADGGITSK